jgi:hypothetical protein
MAAGGSGNQQGGQGGPNGGGPKGGGNDRGTMGQQQDRRNMDAARAAGNRAPGVARGGGFGTGSSTAAQHQIAIGKTRAPSIPAGGVAQGNYPTQDDAMADYAKAVGKHATRGFFDKALDFLGGGFYDPKEPMAGNPRSFAGGDFHSTTNPGSVMGALLGGFGGGVGSLLGKFAGPAYTKAGLPEIWHGGYGQPDLRNGIMGNTDNPMGGSMADIGGGHTYSSGSGPGATGAGPSFAGGGSGNSGIGSYKPASAPQPSMNNARAQALGPSNPMQSPAWWRTPFPGGA